MRTIKYTIFMLLTLAAAISAQAQGLSITQIGTERLLSFQETRLYLSAPALGFPNDIESGGIRVFESGDGIDFQSRPIKRISLNPNAEEGISFFLLVDNSGSMWTDMAGKESGNRADLRVEQAKYAAKAFLSRLGPRDRVGLAVFNTRYWNAALPGAAPEEVSRALDELSRPVSEDAYTELYLSMERALQDFSSEPGRRVLIVLSDGENFPYALTTGKPNPETGLRSAVPADVIDSAVRDGVSIYAVRLGDVRDPLLGTVAAESGGRSFDAMDGEELSGIYDGIRRDVLAEIAVDYQAGMDRGEKRWVRTIVLGADGRDYVATRHYYAGTVLGQNAAEPKGYYVLFILVAVLFWLALVLFKLERETDQAGLRLLFSSKGQPTRFFALAGQQTVIGAAPDADVSIVGNPSLKASHATILFDEGRNAYTVVSDAPITVNNQTVTKRRLESGDVINMAGTVVVFDETLAKVTKKKKTPAGGRKKKKS